MFQSQDRSCMGSEVGCFRVEINAWEPKSRPRFHYYDSDKSILTEMSLHELVLLTRIVRFHETHFPTQIFSTSTKRSLLFLWCYSLMRVSYIITCSSKWPRSIYWTVIHAYKTKTLIYVFEESRDLRPYWQGPQYWMSLNQFKHTCTLDREFSHLSRRIVRLEQQHLME